MCVCVCRKSAVVNQIFQGDTLKRWIVNASLVQLLSFGFISDDHGKCGLPKQMLLFLRNDMSCVGGALNSTHSLTWIVIKYDLLLSFITPLAATYTENAVNTRTT